MADKWFWRTEARRLRKEAKAMLGRADDIEEMAETDLKVYDPAPHMPGDGSETGWRAAIIVAIGCLAAVALIVLAAFN